MKKLIIVTMIAACVALCAAVWPFDRSQRRCLIVALEHQGKLPLLHGRHPVLVGCQQGLGLRQLTPSQIAGRRAVQTGSSHGAQ